MVLHRAIWCYMALHGAAWHYMALHGAIWCNIMLHVTIWCHMALHGATWCYGKTKFLPFYILSKVHPIYSSVPLIPLIHWYVSAAVYWCFTRQSFGYINCFVTVDSFYIEWSTYTMLYNPTLQGSWLVYHGATQLPWSFGCRLQSNKSKYQLITWLAILFMK